MDFYTAGRGGALGDVPADVVTAAFVFFEPERRARGVGPIGVGDAAPAGQPQEWAGRSARVGARAPPRRFRLAARSPRSQGGWSTAAPVAGAPLFAGWRTLPEPADPRELALHRLNGLRELRGALHGAAVLTVGLLPVEAIVVRTPEMLSVFGWPEPYPDPEPFHQRWALAEARTDRMFGRTLAVLDDAERGALVELLGTLDVMTMTEIPTAIHRGDDELPWVDIGDGSLLKVLQIKEREGLWVIRNRFSPGYQVQTHKHTGPVYAFTTSGAWKYKESDFVNRAGSFLYEPAGSVHTLIVPDDNTEPTDVFFAIWGANLNLDADGNVESVIDAGLVLQGYYLMCEAAGLPKPAVVLD